MKIQKLLQKLFASQKQFKYKDLVRLLVYFGFTKTRQRGSHEIYKNQNNGHVLNIQNRKGYIKHYQIKQFISYLENYERLDD